jgi:NAD(P)-dependent dehydrogenase (short-subunit alcohol dehydrogenase family)
MRLAGKVALVTGAGAGLGRAVALRYAEEGAQVIAVSLHAHELEEVQQIAATRGLLISTIPGDVGDVATVERTARTVLDRFGRLDVLVNNAGIIIVKPVEETSVAEWDRVLATNLRGPFLYCRAFVPAMKAQSDGVIINVSSQSGFKGFVGEAAYCPSKFGLEGLTYTLALELAPWHIRVVAVHPGIGMRTPMSETTYDEEARKTWREPSVITPAFVHLAAERDAALSGRRYNACALAQQLAGHDENAPEPRTTEGTELMEGSA